MESTTGYTFTPSVGAFTSPAIHVGRNLWICAIHGSACAKDWIHSLRRNPWMFVQSMDFVKDANHFTIVIPRWRRHIY